MSDFKKLAESRMKDLAEKYSETFKDTPDIQKVVDMSFRAGFMEAFLLIKEFIEE